jgi:site-specific DNA-methyltransferase (adenine-specific)
MLYNVLRGKMETYITISQASKILGVSTQTLRRWDASKRFISKRHPINNYRVYTPEQIDDFLINIDVKKKKYFSKEPFFSTEFGKLYHDDAVNFLSSLESNSIQLIFADPPYNIKKAEWDSFETQKDYVDWSLGWIKEAHRVLDNNGSLYICGFSEILADLKWAASSLFTGCKWLVWYYRNKANLSNDWGRSHESILHFRKSKKYTFNVDEVRVPYNEHTLKYPQHPQATSSQYGNGKKYVWTPHPKGAKPKDVLEIPTLTNNSWERKDHPTQKPVELVKKCILASSNIGDVVVDPFGGSGTTYAVSEAFKRNWLGCENQINYCNTIKERISDINHINKIASDAEEGEAVKRRKKLRG